MRRAFSLSPSSPLGCGRNVLKHSSYPVSVKTRAALQAQLPGCSQDAGSKLSLEPLAHRRIKSLVRMEFRFCFYCLQLGKPPSQTPVTSKIYDI